MSGKPTCHWGIEKMSETIEREGALVVIPASSLPVVIAADKDNLLGGLAEKLRAFKADASTEHGRKAIASMARQVSSTKADLLRIADRVSEEARKTHKAIVAEKNVIEDRLDALRDQVRAPLTQYEQIEKDRCEGHERAIAAIKSAANLPEGIPASAIENAIQAFDAANHLDRDWREFEPRAREAHANARNALRIALADRLDADARAAKAAEEAAAEAERQRVEAARLQAEREARIAAEAAQRAREAAEARAAQEAAAAAKREQDARDAADRAKREAEAAERRRLDAIAQAERDRVAAEESAARRQAEAVEAERRRAAQAEEARRQSEAREAEALRRADESRAANVAHQRKINNEALHTLCGAANLTTEQGQAVIAAIAKGAVSHVRIVY